MGHALSDRRAREADRGPARGAAGRIFTGTTAQIFRQKKQPGSARGEKQTQDKTSHDGRPLGDPFPSLPPQEGGDDVERITKLVRAFTAFLRALAELLRLFKA